MTRPRSVPCRLKRNAACGGPQPLKQPVELANRRTHQPHGCVSQSRMVGGPTARFRSKPHGYVQRQLTVIWLRAAAAGGYPTRQFAQTAARGDAAPTCLACVDKRFGFRVGGGKNGW